MISAKQGGSAGSQATDGCTLPDTDGCALPTEGSGGSAVPDVRRGDLDMEFNRNAA